jgi:Zn-dependent M28 family amino/carboxypeptidase
LARDFIFSNFQAMGYDVWLDPFSFKSDEITYTNCNNVVAIKPGLGGTNIYVVGAHYDTVDPPIDNVTVCPGADDNGSGVAGMLETARAIKDYSFRDTIIFIAFDSEEMGYHGSINFVDTHTTENPLLTNSTTFYRPAIRGMISADMIGFADSIDSNRVLIISAEGNTNTPLHHTLAQAMTRYSLLEPFYDTEDNSDHRSFHYAGIDAVLVNEYDFQSNPNYHADTDSTDSSGYINYAYGAENAKAITGYLGEQAQAILPVTFAPPIVNGNLFTLSWDTTPGVSYEVYSRISLTDTNGWLPLVQFGPSLSNSAFEVQINIDGEETQMFKADSY